MECTPFAYIAADMNIDEIDRIDAMERHQEMKEQLDQLDNSDNDFSGIIFLKVCLS